MANQMPPDWCGTTPDGGAESSFQPPSNKEILLDAIDKTVKDPVETITPVENVATPPEVDEAPPDDWVPGCITQNPIPKFLQDEDGSASIMLGLEGEIPRWAPGSVIKWAAWEAGFKSPEDAKYAAVHLQIATQKWNDLGVGVTFEWVPLAKDATFVLAYGGENGNTLASAFFPNAADLSWLLVYSAAFARPYWKKNMWKVFSHELGHVLGLRHEFAMDINPATGLIFEKKAAFQFGDRDPDSVMTYKQTPPEISQADIANTKAFYALTEDERGSQPKIGGTIISDYTPM